MRIRGTFFSLVVVLAASVLVTGCKSVPNSAQTGSLDYMRVVRGYADAMIAHGRDNYAVEHSPLFASALDRATFSLPESLAEIQGIRKHDRVYSGGNPMHDENFYMMLYVLSQVTGDPSYAREADAALQWFFRHAQSPATGLFTWGEHMYWDFTKETMGGNDIHEMYRPWVLLEDSYRLAPEAMTQFSRGLWEHQIGDHTQGFFSRHAHWSKHEPGAGMEFPRHAGFYIAQWAEAYRHTQDPEFLNAIAVMVDYYDRVRNSRTGALPNSSPLSGKPVVCWDLSELSLSIDLWEAKDKVPRALGRRMADSALKTDVHFLALPHVAGDPRKGILAAASYDSLEWTKDTKYCPEWVNGYGIESNAQAALMCYERFRQTRNKAYRKLTLDVARGYLNAEPDSPIELYPGVFGDVIFLMITAHRLTGEQQFLGRAQSLANQAIGLFWDNGPLPRASSKTCHYESITRADTLARALLLLSEELHGRRLSVQYVDR